MGAWNLSEFQGQVLSSEFTLEMPTCWLKSGLIKQFSQSVTSLGDAPIDVEILS